MVVLTGAPPGALATTSTWLAPGCSGTDVVKIPAPTCADSPATCTVALLGVTVPLTVTRSADVELPSAGASTWTCTDGLEDPHPDIATVTRTPVAIHATAVGLIGDNPFIPSFSARERRNLSVQVKYVDALGGSTGFARWIVSMTRIGGAVAALGCGMRLRLIPFWLVAKSLTKKCHLKRGKVQL
jgi:hypothetical protein